MKLYEFLTGFLMMGIVIGIIALCHPAEACGDLDKPNPAPVVKVVVA